MPEAPYLKKLETIEDFDVWEVDGEHIRNKINREFTNFGQHFRFDFIPTKEFWIDKQHGSDETDYFINHMLVEWDMMKNGVSYDKALGAADLLEKRERSKSDLMKKLEKKVSSINSDVPKEIYKEKIDKYKGVVKVYIVSGEAVRGLYFIDFTEGGHHFVYDFVPLNEVWIDDDLPNGEREFVILHELHERYLMSTGMDYHHAHRSSSIIEYKCRNDEKLLKAAIDSEIEKNKEILETIV